MKKPVRKNIKRQQVFTEITHDTLFLKSFVDLIRSDIDVLSLCFSDYGHGVDSIIVDYSQLESKEDFQKRLDKYDRKVQKEKYINILNDNFVKYDSFIRDLK
jgi:hypothetical protein